MRHVRVGGSRGARDRGTPSSRGGLPARGPRWDSSTGNSGLPRGPGPYRRLGVLGADRAGRSTPPSSCAGPGRTSGPRSGPDLDLDGQPGVVTTRPSEPRRGHSQRRASETVRGGGPQGPRLRTTGTWTTDLLGVSPTGSGP